MKINDKDVLSSSPQNIARTGAGNNSMRPNQSSSTTAAGSRDAVDLSSRSQVFSDALTAGESARSARVEQLRQLYASGQYQVDSQEVSRAIIDAHFGS